MKRIFQPTIAVAVVALIILAVHFYPMMASQRSVLAMSEQFTLYSLQPRGDINGNEPLGSERFHRYRVLGKALITDPQEKSALVNALYDGLTGDPEMGAACFEPRHGIRAVKGGRTVEVVVCFECEHIEFVENGRSNFTHITHSPLPVFDNALRSAGLPLGHRKLH